MYIFAPKLCADCTRFHFHKPKPAAYGIYGFASPSRGQSLARGQARRSAFTCQ